MGRTDFYVVFLTSQKNSHALLIPTCLKKNEMWRGDESSVSFKTSVLGRRGRGEQPKLLKQRAGRAECSLLAQESYFICFKLDQIYRKLKKSEAYGCASVSRQPARGHGQPARRAAWGDLVTARLDHGRLERAGGGPQHVTGDARGFPRSLVAPKLLMSPSWSQAQQRVRSAGIGCTAHGGTESHPNYLSVCSHLGKLQFGKFGCTDISCLLNHSKYLGLCSLGLLKSAGESVAVCMHGRGSRGVGHPAPTVAGDCDVG